MLRQVQHARTLFRYFESFSARCFDNLRTGSEPVEGVPNEFFSNLLRKREEMTAARAITLLLALLVGSPAKAATKDDPPDREMLKMMEFLKEMEMIKQMEMLRDMPVVEASGEPAKNSPTQKSPSPRKKENLK